MVREEIENVWVGWGLELVVENERMWRVMSPRRPSDRLAAHAARQARRLIRRTQQINSYMSEWKQDNSHLRPGPGGSGARCLLRKPAQESWRCYARNIDKDVVSSYNVRTDCITINSWGLICLMTAVCHKTHLTRQPSQGKYGFFYSHIKY